MACIPPSNRAGTHSSLTHQERRRLACKHHVIKHTCTCVCIHSLASIGYMRQSVRIDIHVGNADPHLPPHLQLTQIHAFSWVKWQNHSHYLKDNHPKQVNFNSHNFIKFMMQLYLVPSEHTTHVFVPVLCTHIPKMVLWSQGTSLSHSTSPGQHLCFCIQFCACSYYKLLNTKPFLPEVRILLEIREEQLNN